MMIRLDAEPVRAVRTDARLWNVAEDQPPFCGPWPGEELPDITRRLLAALPEDAKRVHDFFGGRNHQQAEYLLDPVGYRNLRDADARARTAEHRAIFGERLFAAHATSGQGIPWRCSTAAELARAARLIDDLDVAAARREYSVAEMHELGVYKVHEGEDDTESFGRNLRDLHAWADHCRSVAARGLDLMITLF
ncbi:hypothetical protein MB27_23295 [Actinoplanes utahensis]|uniref:DUF1877 domain-containing protein n=2 Tax=Actinoplanes utahensis TaxID=1869 RepID=A0A0A6UJY4_ACTUT|nr:hypothetical protein MB27_23295 [Actinoplanes utahensis]